MSKTVLLLSLVVSVGLLALSPAAEARDDRIRFSVDAAMSTSDAQTKLGDEVQFFFGEGNHPAVARTIGNWQSNKKSNGVGYSDEQSCNRAFLSAMISLRDRAVKEGGNAVVNIVSFYKRNHYSSESEFECGAGRIMAGVTFRGDVVVLE